MNRAALLSVRITPRGGGQQHLCRYGAKANVAPAAGNAMKFL
jgi:hypothetical protein